MIGKRPSLGSLLKIVDKVCMGACYKKVGSVSKIKIGDREARAYVVKFSTTLQCGGDFCIFFKGFKLMEGKGDGREKSEGGSQ